jgi:HSP20 family protein
MDRLMKHHRAASGSQSVYPAINIYDDGETYRVRAEVPGLDKDSLEVTATHNTLALKGARKSPTVEDASYHRRERDFGTFSRSIRLPQPVDSAKVAANYKNGVLEVVLPRAEETRPRKVKVQS